MRDELIKMLINKRILILGFGKEGQSTYRLISKFITPKSICIADQDEDILNKIDLIIDKDSDSILGDHYQDRLDEFDLIIKSPGIPSTSLAGKIPATKITSQTDLFLKLFSPQTIGITGTKGKSTTSSLIKFILSKHFDDVILVGNIGVPPFDLFKKINPATIIVFELSSYQLEDLTTSPSKAVLLNLYEEHLDHHKSFLNYQLAKFNITKFQQELDCFVLNGDDTILQKLYNESGLKRNLLQFSLNQQTNFGAFKSTVDQIVFKTQDEKVDFDFTKRDHLRGDHNLMNIMAAICICKLMEVPDQIISDSINHFKGLEHRMEYVGMFGGIHFYNDSIATIPEATMHAVRALKEVDTLILGGNDRGIDYSGLAEFLLDSDVRNLIFLGDAGKRILKILKSMKPNKEQDYFVTDNFEKIENIIRSYTKPAHICLLSPAASSYGMFRNFEERGNAFKKIAGKI